jgi:hypothetical protein
MATNIVGATGIDKVQDGIIVNADIDTVAASKLTGALPAISGASLTALPAGNLTGTVADARISALTASKLTGALPAISGASLTALNATQLTSGTLPIARIADDAITLAKMASGTDGNIISYDASGNPVAIATGNDGQILTSAGAGAPPAFEDAGTGKILQIVQDNNTTHTSASTTDNTWTDTVVTDAITPTSTSSKIFVSYRIAVHFTDSSSYAGYALRCKRAISGGATSYPAHISSYGSGNHHSAFFMQTNTGNDFNMMHTITGVDSPSTTSAVTYTVGVSGIGINGVLEAGGQYSARWDMLLMEIEG